MSGLAKVLLDRCMMGNGTLRTTPINVDEALVKHKTSHSRLIKSAMLSLDFSG